MVDRADINGEGASTRSSGAHMSAAEADEWFASRGAAAGSALMQFLQHNWRNKSDIADLRQDVYVQVYEAACERFPTPEQFVFATARNLLIDRVRREQVVPIEAVADLDALEIADRCAGAGTHPSCAR